MCNEFNLASINTGLFPIGVWVQGSLLGSLPKSQAEGANSLPQVWHSIGPRLASLARFRDPSEATFALFGNLRHSSGSVFAHLRIPIGHYRDTERQHEALPFPKGQREALPFPESGAKRRPPRPSREALRAGRTEKLQAAKARQGYVRDG